MNIGDVVSIKVTVVDYNEGSQKAKLQIEGYAEDKRSIVYRYIWLDYKDIQNNLSN